MTTPARQRKPLRRTAWGLLIAGLAGLVVVVGAGLVASASSPEAGPGQEATWPAGEPMALYPVPLAGDDNDVAHCRLRPEGEKTWRDYDVSVWELEIPDHPGDATITCDQAVTVQTGAALRISELTRRGPLIAVPLAAAVLGGFLFFPRFLHFLGYLANPPWVRRLLRLPPPR